MPGPQESSRQEGKKISENDISCHQLIGYVTKLFLESEFQHKGNEQTKAVFLAGTDSENKII